MFLTDGNFLDEEACFLSDKSYRFNCFRFISRQSRCIQQVRGQNINTGFVVEHLEKFPFQIEHATSVVLDNACIHKTKTKTMKERMSYWQKRGLYLLFLPAYSPHLNIAGTLWRKMKKEWIVPPGYLIKDDIAYAINRCLANMGDEHKINFSRFNLN